MQSGTLIQSCIDKVNDILFQAEKLKNKELGFLLWRPDETSWNILECLEHLNLYGDFYLPEIESNIQKNKHPGAAEFKSGLLGSYFAKMMLPKEKLNKMKTFKDKDPIKFQLDKTVIDQFMNQQIKLLDLLNESSKVNLNKIKIRTSISNLIRLKLGDTFQFFINHMVRHMKQIETLQTRYKEIMPNKAV